MVIIPAFDADGASMEATVVVPVQNTPGVPDVLVKSIPGYKLVVVTPVICVVDDAETIDPVSPVGLGIISVPEMLGPVYVPKEIEEASTIDGVRSMPSV